MEPAEGLGKTWKIADGAFGGKFRREGFQMLRVTSQLPFVSRLAMAIMGVVLLASLCRRRHADGHVYFETIIRGRREK